MLAHPLVLAASGFMCFVEFFADKIPGVDSAWDVVQTFIRIPAGAALAASVFGDSSTATMLAAAIVGGTLAAGSHVAKTGGRALINTSPEPFSNWAASFGEELAVGTVLWLAFAHPDRRAGRARACWCALMIWLIPKVWRTVRAHRRRAIAAWFAGLARRTPLRRDAACALIVCLPARKRRRGWNSSRAALPEAAIERREPDARRIARVRLRRLRRRRLSVHDGVRRAAARRRRCSR